MPGERRDKTLQAFQALQEEFYEHAKNFNWSQMLAILEHSPSSSLVNYQKPSSGWTALHQAAYGGSAEVVTALLKHQALAHLPNWGRRTALDQAKWRADKNKSDERAQETYKVLQDLETQTEAMLSAAKAGNEQQVLKMIDACPHLLNQLAHQRSYGVLHQAAWSGNNAFLGQLLSRDTCMVQLTTPHCETALDVAIRQGKDHVATAELLRHHLTTRWKQARELGAAGLAHELNLCLNKQLTVQPALLSGLCAESDTDFEANVRFLEGCMDRCKLKSSHKAQVLEPASQATIQMLRSFQPVHRCSPKILEAVIKTGCLMSNKQLVELMEASTPAACTQLMQTSLQLVDLKREHTLKTHWELVTACVQLEVKKLLMEGPDEKDAKGMKVKKKKTALGQAAHEARIKLAVVLQETAMTKGRNENADDALAACLRKIEEAASYIANQIQTLHGLKATGTAGVGYFKDKWLGTDKHVFAILGPNTATTYGEICVLVKPEIMCHPDFFLTPVAATGFVAPWGYVRRPWALYGRLDRNKLPSKPIKGKDNLAIRVYHTEEKDNVISVNQGIHVFQQSKLHPLYSPGWDKILAREVEAQAKMRLLGVRRQEQASYHFGGDLNAFEMLRERKKDPATKHFQPAEMEPGLLSDFYMRCESHALIECHMPASTPLDYVEKLLIPKATFAKMNQDVLKYVLPDGRSLLSIVEQTDDHAHSIRWQLEYFKKKQMELGKVPAQATLVHPVPGLRMLPNVRVEPTSSPTFLPFTFDATKGATVSFLACEKEEIHVFFSNNRLLQGQTLTVGAAKAELYSVCFGVQQNQRSIITRGWMSDPCQASVAQADGKTKTGKACTTTEQGAGIVGKWDRYWVSFNTQSGWLVGGKGPVPTKVVCACDKTAWPVVEQETKTDRLVCVKWRDPAPVANINLIGLGTSTDALLVFKLECLPPVTMCTKGCHT